MASQLSQTREELLVAETKVSELQSELSLSNEHQLELNMALKTLQSQLDADQGQLKACKAQLIVAESKLTACQQRILDLERQLLAQISMAGQSRLSKAASVSTETNGINKVVTGGVTQALQAYVRDGLISADEAAALAGFSCLTSERDEIDPATLLRGSHILLRLLPQLSLEEQALFVNIIAVVTSILN